MIAVNVASGKQCNNYDSTGNWFIYSAGIYYYDLRGLYTELGNDIDSSTFVLLDANIINSVKYDNSDLDKISSISALEDNAGFYFDITNKRIYIRLPNFESPDFYNVVIGISIFIANCKFIDSENNIFYPLIKEDDFSQINNRRTPLIHVSDGNNVIMKETFSFSFINDGTYDDFNNWDVYKQPLEAYYIGTDQSKTTVWKGVIGSYSINANTISIQGIDGKQALDEVVTENYYYSGTYSDLHPDDEFKPMPMRWGMCYKVPITCVNRNIYNPASSQTLTFHVADTVFHDIQAVDNFYIDNVSKTFSNVSTSNGTFDYSKAANEEIDFSKCTATIRGYVDDSGMLITNPADIISDMIANIADKNYNSTNYNTVRWSYIRSLLRNGYLDAGEEKIIDCISRVIAQNATFIIDPDGRYNLSKQNYSQSPSHTINKQEILNLSTLSESYNTAEVFARINLGYSNGLNYIYNTDEQTVIDKYRTKNVFKYNTSLSSSAFVDNLAEEISNILSIIRPVYRIELSLQDWYFLEIDDVVSVQIDRPVSEWRGYRDLIIEGTSIDGVNERMIITARYVGETTIEPYIVTTSLLGGEIMGGDHTAGGPV